MLFINKNTENEVVFTGTELSTLTANTQFLFVCTNRQTKEDVTFVAPNNSTATTRYDKTSFYETGTTANYTATTPSISLTPGAYWDVKIYSQYSATNLDVSGTTELVERDIMYVSGYTSSSTTYFTGATTTNHIFLRSSV